MTMFVFCVVLLVDPLGPLAGSEQDKIHCLNMNLFVLVFLLFNVAVLVHFEALGITAGILIYLLTSTSWMFRDTRLSEFFRKNIIHCVILF